MAISLLFSINIWWKLPLIDRKCGACCTLHDVLVLWWTRNGESLEQIVEQLLSEGGHLCWGDAAARAHTHTLHLEDTFAQSNLHYCLSTWRWQQIIEPSTFQATLQLPHTQRSYNCIHRISINCTCCWQMCCSTYYTALHFTDTFNNPRSATM